MFSSSSPEHSSIETLCWLVFKMLLQLADECQTLLRITVIDSGDHYGLVTCFTLPQTDQILF